MFYLQKIDTDGQSVSGVVGIRAVGVFWGVVGIRTGDRGIPGGNRVCDGCVSNEAPRGCS